MRNGITERMIPFFIWKGKCGGSSDLVVPLSASIFLILLVRTRRRPAAKSIFAPIGFKNKGFANTANL